MIRFNLSSQALGNTRFAVSPIAEAALSARLLNTCDPARHPHAPWFREVRPRLNTVDMEFLLALVAKGRWVPSCLVPAGRTTAETIEDQLSELADLPLDRLREDFHKAWAEHPPSSRIHERLRDPRAFEIIADTIGSYWHIAIEPFWPRMRAVLEDDIYTRTGSLASVRVFDMLSDLHREITIKDDTLMIDKPAHSDRTCQATQITLIPAIFAWPKLITELTLEGTFNLTYSAMGAARAWAQSPESPAKTPNVSLAGLLGQGRSMVLAATSQPRTTTQIANVLGKSLATVSEHLTVLRQGGLVSPQRVGRHVLYWQTPLAESLIEGVA